MNKSQLVKRISNDTGLSQATAGTALQSVLSAITETIQAGEKVLLVDFGTFRPGKRSCWWISGHSRSQSGRPVRAGIREPARKSRFPPARQ